MKYDVSKIIPVTHHMLPDYFSEVSYTLVMSDGRRMIVTVSERGMKLDVEDLFFI